MARTTTNTDKIEKIMESLGRIEEKVDAVDQRLQFTNGKVASLMEDKIRRDERDKVAAELKASPATQVQTKEGNVIVAPPSYWTSKEKLYGALALLATAIATFLGIWGAR